MADADEDGPVGAELIGFEFPDDVTPAPRVIPVEGGAIDLEVCADSFAEFLYRFWVDNEIFFALANHAPLAPAVASNAARLPRTGHR